MKVGTLPWLLYHELRLWWRELSSNRSSKILMGVFGAFGAFFMAILGLALYFTREALSGTIPDWALWVALAAWLLGFFYAFTQAINQSVIALFDRGDLDLLVSSPISSKVIFASRLLGVAIEVFLSFSLFVVPFSILAVLIGIPRLLGVYPALIGLSLFAASLAMLLTLWLVRLMGARRARTFAQLLNAVITAILFLSSQLPNMLRGTNFNAEEVLVRLQFLFAEGNILSADSLLWFPARAIFFDPLSVLLTLLSSSALAWLAVETMHHSFISGTQQSVTRKHRQFRSTKEKRFSSNLNRILLFKEWRLIWRNPYLISQAFLQVIFLLPMLFVVLTNNGGKSLGSFTTFVAMVTALVGSHLAATLTRICVSGEEAPDLLKSSPVDSSKLRRFKLLAALIPVWLLMSPMFVILMVRGEPWLSAIAIFLGATIGSAILRLWNSRPIPMADLFKRRQNQQGDLMLGFLEFISYIAWGCLGFGSGKSSAGWVLIPLGIILAVFALAYWRSRQLGTSMGF
jgi:ABC-2 type transport system permease protein